MFSWFVAENINQLLQILRCASYLLLVFTAQAVLELSARQQRVTSSLEADVRGTQLSCKAQASEVVLSSGKGELFSVVCQEGQEFCFYWPEGVKGVGEVFSGYSALSTQPPQPQVSEPCSLTVRALI